MADEPDNLVLELLRQIRDDQRAMREEMDEMRLDLTTRIDGNTLILNFLAGLVSDHEDRITALEGSDTEPAE
ncbi:MAG: hypothetical protein RIB53_03140 [Roseitalea porphyridii]|jgi:hypothetical protein|uniref:hypothetical protein n=1 Tax=Roseitalea porphyridii TaxID=1852022 RepID=UPI0032ECC624